MVNLDLQPFLENKLVKIRPLKQADFGPLYQAASDHSIWEQHQDKQRHTPDGFTKFFKESLHSKGALCILDGTTNEVIGSSRMKIIDEDDKVVEIGWTFLMRKYWGGEYNREVKKMMINHILNGAEKVVFYVDKNNIRSQKALEKLGALKMNFPGASWVLDKENGLTYVIAEKIV